MRHIGILGGGQLAQMFLKAAHDFDETLETTVLERDVKNICKDFATHSINGSLQDPEKIRELVASVDITTYEIEHIDIQTLLQLEKEGHRFSPSPKILQIIQDKGLQKQFFTQHGLPTAPYQIVQSAQEIGSIVDEFFGEKIVIKSCTGGYDGKGVVVTKKEEVEQGVLFTQACVVEQFIPGATELAVMVARDMMGNMICWDIVEMVFNKHNTLSYQLCPARISPDIAEQAKQIARKTIEAFDGIGIFAVEFFLTREKVLLINEIAPRPHNSGHHTIDTCTTSQFTQLTRILLGGVLGSVKTKGSSMMINLLGPADHTGAYQLVDEEALRKYSNVFIHLYDKFPSRPNRKLGHVTILGTTTEALLKQYNNIFHLLRLVPTHDDH